MENAEVAHKAEKGDPYCHVDEVSEVEYWAVLVGVGSPEEVFEVGEDVEN